MTLQGWFLLSLHVIGVLFGLRFRRLPFAFVAMSGLLWGAMYWVVVGAILLLIGVRVSIGVVASVVAVPLIVLAGLNLKAGGVRRNQWGWIVLGIAVITAALLIAERYNFTVITPDSVSIIQLGRAFADDGIRPLSGLYLADWNLFLPVMHMAASAVGSDYLYLFPPVFAVMAWLTFLSLMWYASRRVTESNSQTAVIFVPIALLTLTMYGVIVQAVYIHSNFLAAMYLFAGAVCLWLAFSTENSAFMAFGVLALIAFSLTRRESVAIGVLYAALALPHASYRQRLAKVLPYTAITLPWLVIWMRLIRPDQIEMMGYVMHPRLLVFVAITLTGVVIFVVGSRHRWIEARIEYVSVLMVVAMLLLLGGIVMMIPQKMADSAYKLVLNLLNPDWWGLFWIAAFALIPLLLVMPRIPHERFLILGIGLFFVVILCLRYVSGPLYFHWMDSGNRMAMEIAPVTAFYIAVKLSYGLAARTASAS